MFGVLNTGVAASLERGTFDGWVARGVARLWARRAEVVRQVVLPEGVAVIGVGGATLGGSYKTPLVLALARALAERGESCSVVASGYRARLRAARRVRPADSAAEVGDEALWFSRALAPHGVPVVTGPERDAAIRLAASLAPRVLVDSLLQTRPVALALSILALDDERPWGAGECPPVGDLKASREALLGAADVVVRVGGGGSVFCVESGVAYADAASGSGAAIELASLRGARVGLVTAIARPDRVVRALERAGVHPVEVLRFADHATPRSGTRARCAAPDLWLTTQKCATKMGAAFEGSDLFVLRHELGLPEALLRIVTTATPRAPGGSEQRRDSTREV